MQTYLPENIIPAVVVNPTIKNGNRTVLFGHLIGAEAEIEENNVGRKNSGAINGLSNEFFIRIGVFSGATCILSADDIFGKVISIGPD
jgi:hypothetical protein